ncbi:MAG TPA: 16S rRNA (uracil(1498)-N(3))-methyltransferase [Xanthobacteraceae bacterium]|nr:16S rRNA (uracil(1498)-N(3))-methyltransferase [Xanthobacteraceae bacterium]
MARYDFRTPRLYVSADLGAGVAVSPSDSAAHYLRHVLRLQSGAKLLVFNGRDGEWEAELALASKRGARLEILKQARAQPAASTLHYAFAPVKQARFDFVVQKAVEMGAGRLTPVLTQHTQVTRVNLERVRANAVEAAEQCGILALPEIEEPMPFANWLAGISPDRVLAFCDEDAEISDPLRALREAPAGAVTLVIGPEGGFHPKEREALLAHPRVVRLSLGPRILRADTAAVAALAIVQAARGDWR